jgi:hypothetical protein
MSANEVMAKISDLPELEREKLVLMLLRETDWLEDILDGAIAKERLKEPERPAEMLLREQGLLG